MAAQPPQRVEPHTSQRQTPTAGRWLIGIIAAIVLLAAAVVPIGLAALFLAPMAVVLGIGMLAVWIARRHRQTLEGRDAGERKNAAIANPPWPTGVIDDRLNVDRHE